MSSFIQSLIEDGRMLRYVDWRTGSNIDLAKGTAVSTNGLPRFKNSGRGVGLHGDGTTANYVTLDPTGMRPSSAGLGVLVAIFPIDNIGTGSGYIIGGGSVSITLYWYTPTQLTAYNGTLLSSSTAAMTALLSGARSVGANFGGGIQSDLFVDGTRYAGHNILTYTGDPSNIVTGGYKCPTIIHAEAFFDMDSITDVDIARLHRELTAGPTIVHRPTKHFSIPYPSKTPAEYAADSVLFDLNGNLQDLSPSGLTPQPTAHPVSKVTNGVFDSCTLMGEGILKFPTAITSTNYMRSSLTFHVWWNPNFPPAIPNLGMFLGTASVNYFGRDAAGHMYWRYRDNSLTSIITGGITIIPIGWHHLTYSLQVDGATITTKLYVDGIIDGTTVQSNGWSISVSAGYFGSYNDTSIIDPIGGSVSSAKYLVDVVATPAEVRAEYLLGARKCLLDARVHSDGSCPVSLAAVGAPNEIANGWKVNSGSWKIIEDAPVNGKPGDRWLESQSSGIIYQKNLNAYGSWFFEIEKNIGGVSWFGFISDTIGAYNYGLSNGYTFGVDGNNRVYLFKCTAGVVSTIFFTVINYITSDRYKFWITRRFDGEFSLWIKGGVYTTWTLMPPDSSFTNPTTDNTYTTSEYITQYDTALSNKSIGVQHFLGEINIFEGIKAGIIEGEIPEPFWVVTTTDTTQSWLVRLAIGSVYVFDWGDGQMTWHNGTGANETITHTYLSAGTYTITLRAIPSDIERWIVTSTGLIGTFPDISAATNLIYYRLAGNIISGTLPSLTTHTSLLNVEMQTNQITGYEPSVLAITINYMDLSANALTQTAVDQVLSDFNDNIAARPASGTINLSSGTNATPSATGLIYKANIIAHGWIVSTN